MVVHIFTRVTVVACLAERFFGVTVDDVLDELTPAAVCLSAFGTGRVHTFCLIFSILQEEITFGGGALGS